MIPVKLNPWKWGDGVVNFWVNTEGRFCLSCSNSDPDAAEMREQSVAEMLMATGLIDATIKAERKKP